VIYYNFDTNMSRNILNSIIEELHKIGFNVLSIVNDMGSAIMDLWRSLNISITNTSFQHPITNNNIYVFADVPHLKVSKKPFT